VDEAKRYEGVIAKINEEKNSIRTRSDRTKKHYDEWRMKIAKGKPDPAVTETIEEMRANMRREKDLTIGYRFQLSLLELGRQGYLEYQSKAKARLDSETTVLSSHTGEFF